MLIYFTKREVLLILSILSVQISACSDYYDYSPYQTNASQTALTQKAIDRLEESSSEEFVPFNFTIIADLHNHYDEGRRVVGHINQFSLSEFSVVAGDFTDMGLLQEFEWSHSVMANLKMPYFLAIGNHDYLSNGSDVYHKMYGPKNFSFIYRKVKFIFFDNNQPEFGGKEPNLNWLEAELLGTDSLQHVIIVSHVSFFDSRVSETIRVRLEQLMFDYNVSLTIHGHAHTRSEQQRSRSDGGVTKMLINGSIDRHDYSLVNVDQDDIAIHEIQL